MNVDKLYYFDVITQSKKNLRQNQCIYIVLNADGFSYCIQALSTTLKHRNFELIPHAQPIWHINREDFFKKIEEDERFVRNFFPGNLLTNTRLTRSEAEVCFGRELTVNTAIIIAPFSSVNPYAKLRQASISGDIATLQELIDLQVDLNYLNARDNSSAAVVAAFYGHTEFIEMLYKYGADLNKARQDGVTPAFFAAQENFLDMIKVLHKYNADLDKARTNGMTPVFIAAQNGHVNMIRALHQYGADLNAAAIDGATPAFIAAQNNHAAIIEVLNEYDADLNKARQDGVTPAFIAAQNGHVDMIKTLHECGADLNKARQDGVTPAFIAAQNGHVDMIKTLHECGADLNKAEQSGATPAYIAAQNGHVDMIKTLHECGADLSKAKSDGITPIFSATYIGHIDVINFLVSQNCHLMPWRTTVKTLRSAIQEKNESIMTQVEEFITSRRLVKEDDELEIYPQDIAAIMGHEEIVALFNQHHTIHSQTHLKNELQAARQEDTELHHTEENRPNTPGT